MYSFLSYTTKKQWQQQKKFKIAEYKIFMVNNSICSLNIVHFIGAVWAQEIQLNRSMKMIKIHKFLTPKNMFHSSAYTIFYVPERKTKRTGQKKNKMRNIYNPKIK